MSNRIDSSNRGLKARPLLYSLLEGKWDIRVMSLYIILLHCIYLYIYRTIGPLFRYMYKFQNEAVSWEFGAIAVLYLITICYFTYKQYVRTALSDYFLITLTLLYFLPGVTLLVNGNWTLSYSLFHFCSYLGISLANEIIPQPQKHIANRKVGGGKLISKLSKLISISVIGIVVYYYGFRLTLDLSAIYGLREEWSNSGMPNIFNYYLPFATRITPVLFLLSLKEKKYIDASLLGISQLVSFSFGGMKYTLFALVLAIIFHFSAKSITKNRFLLFFFALCVLSALEILIGAYEQTPFLSTFIQRRMSFIPNQIGYYYFSFFQNESYLLYSDSIMRWALDYPYTKNIPHTIAAYAFNRPEMGANTGLYPEGFTQIGFFVLSIYSIVYVAIFRLYSYCFSNIYGRYGLYIPLLGIVLYTSTFTDGALLSVLATQGFLLFILVVSFISKYIKYEPKAVS